MQTKKLRTVVVREPFRMLCRQYDMTNYETPLILNQFIFLTTVVHDLAVDSLMEDECSDLAAGWIPMSASNMGTMIMSNATRQGVQKWIDDLVDVGWLEKKTEKGKAAQYRVRFVNLERALKDVGYSLTQLGFIFDLPGEADDSGRNDKPVIIKGLMSNEDGGLYVLPYPQSVITAVNAMLENHQGDDYDNSYDEFYEAEMAKGLHLDATKLATPVASEVQPPLQVGATPVVTPATPVATTSNPGCTNKIKEEDKEREKETTEDTRAHAREQSELERAAASVAAHENARRLRAAEIGKKKKKGGIRQLEPDEPDLDDVYDPDDDYESFTNKPHPLDMPQGVVRLVANLTGRTSHRFHSLTEARRWSRADSPARHKKLKYLGWYFDKLLEQADHFNKASLWDKSKTGWTFEQFLSMFESDAKYETYVVRYARDMDDVKQEAELLDTYLEGVKTARHYGNEELAQDLIADYKKRTGKDLF